MEQLFIVFVFALIVLTVVMVIWAILDIFQRNLQLTEKPWKTITHAKKVLLMNIT